MKDRTVVLDASAVLAFRDRDPGAVALVFPMLETATLSAVTAGEVRYKVTEYGDDPDEVIADLKSLGVQLIDFEDRMGRHFPRLRSLDRAYREAHVPSTGRQKRLSLGDLCCLATAVELGLPVVTGDAHWGTLVAFGLPIRVIPYR